MFINLSKYFNKNLFFESCLQKSKTSYASLSEKVKYIITWMNKARQARQHISNYSHHMWGRHPYDDQAQEQDGERKDERRK